MGIRYRYQFCRQDGWNLLVISERWNQGLWAEILSRLEKQAPTDHPQTMRLRYPAGENGEEFYLKIFHYSSPVEILKDFFRASKAFRALKQGNALSGRGFHVPLSLAVGEHRRLRFIDKSFLLTARVEVTLLPYYLKEHFSGQLDPVTLKWKREYLAQLAMEIRRLHQYGFIHGDLTPYNILVQTHGERIVFYLMDNDRTRRYPPWTWLPHFLSKRNLVQLNRFVLPGISLQDRVRFLCYYLGKGTWKKRERRLVRWLEEKTQKKRREREPIDARVSFRELMRWKGSFSRNSEKSRY